MKRSKISVRFLDLQENEVRKRNAQKWKNHKTIILSSLMSVDLSILARGIPIDPLPELYG